MLLPARTRDIIMKCIYTTLLFVAISFFSTTKICAESTVYIFMKSVGNTTTSMSLNGKEVFDMTGPIKKTISPSGDMRLPFHQYAACKKKCTLKNEGKILLSCDCKNTNILNEKVTNFAAEIQLNLTENSVHYIMITNKGLNDVQIIELDEKKANKLLKDKKYIDLPEYIGE